MTNRKVFGIRCDAHRRPPDEWEWFCANGKPVLFDSLEAAQKVCDQARAAMALEGVAIQAVATLYGIERQ